MRAALLVVLMSSAPALAEQIVARDKVTPSSVCTAKQPKDCVSLATLLQHGKAGFAKDVAKAAAYYRIACDATDDGGCVGLAEMYFEGSGVKQDEVEGMRLLREVCKRGSCMSLAYRFVEVGTLFARDEALAIFSRLCAGRGGGAEWERGSACFMRADLGHDDKELWYLRACQLGEDRGCARVARLYFDDQYPGIDETEATRRLEQMCDRKFARACELAAERHRRGLGVLANRAEAERWEKKACDLGSKQACRQRR